MHYSAAWNPGNTPVDYLESITVGGNALAVLDQLLIALRGEIGRPNHQHHLLIGPRGSGKTHLLRLLAASRIPADPTLASAYLSLVMPEEVPLRSPGDLFLKFIERLAQRLASEVQGIAAMSAREARGLCLNALAIAKAQRDPLERLRLAADAIEQAAEVLGRIVLPIAENMDAIFYLGTQQGRKSSLDEHWALRSRLQESPRILLIAAAPVMFGAAGDPGKPFFDFFRAHTLEELSSDEALELIRCRLDADAAAPGDDTLRNERVTDIRAHFDERAPGLRGLLITTGRLPRFVHVAYEAVVGAELDDTINILNGFLDNLTPYFQTRLDPRVMPQAEIDLLHTLALAYGPRQPSELTAELYGVGANEVSELLRRLRERGLVKRIGRPGGQAVTWDLTEPLYRVWTQFRDNPEGPDLYRLLGKLVACLYEFDLLARQRKHIESELLGLPENHHRLNNLRAQERLIDCALDYRRQFGSATPTPADDFTVKDGLPETPETPETLSLDDLPATGRQVAVCLSSFSISRKHSARRNTPSCWF